MPSEDSRPAGTSKLRRWPSDERHQCCGDGGHRQHQRRLRRLLERAGRPAAEARTSGAFELPDLLDRFGRQLGATRLLTYLADLQQQVLTPFLGASLLRELEEELPLPPLSVDSSLAGKVFQDLGHQIQGSTLWLPLVAGTERLGVLAVGLPAGEPNPAALAGFQRLAVAAADLVRGRSPFGDAIVRAQRQHSLSTAAELQYAILPPLSFTSRAVTVAAALEPCYHVAGDTIDYAVDDGRARIAIFDGMGHGLHSAQCAVLTVAAYRAARRAGRSLGETFLDIDEALAAGMQGEIFTTAVLAELDSRTGSLRWVNAGHPAPLLIRGGRVVRELDADARPPLGLGDLLGLGSPTPAVEQLEPGDTVLFYTDGVTEARSPEGDFFGTARLGDLVVRHLAGGLAAPETLRRVVRELLAHHEGQLTDDATLLMLEWRSDGVAPQVPPQPCMDVHLR